MFVLVIPTTPIHAQVFDESIITVNVDELKQVTLIGEAFDTDVDDILAFEWEQIQGDPVELSAYDVHSPTFMPPSVANGEVKTLVFRLTVTDGYGGSVSEFIEVVVYSSNNQPTVDAGKDQVIFPTMRAITFTAIGYDADDYPLRFEWTQLSGQPLLSDSIAGKHLTITSSSIDFDNVQTPIVFEVTAYDGFGGIASDQVELFPLLYSGTSNPLLFVDAGPLQVVNEDSLVFLDGSGHSVNNNPISFTWEQRLGPKVDLSDIRDPQTSFVAPSLENGDDMLLSFILNGYSSGAGYASDIAIVKVTSVNNPPIVDAGMDQTVRENTRVKLFGTASDPDNDNIHTNWKQVAGIPVDLSYNVLGEAYFVSPNLQSYEAERLVFEFTASDMHGGTASDNVLVTTTSNNRAPYASAGPEQTVRENTLVTITGSGWDPDGDPLTFSWKQLSGDPVEFTQKSNIISFVASDLESGERKNLIFELVVTDPFGMSSMDRVLVTVIPDNIAPVANAGLDQTVDEGKLVKLNCSGWDPDGDALVYRWNQESGPTPTDAFVTGSELTFTSPRIVSDTTMSFTCTVSDQEFQNSDIVNVRVINVISANIVADAGPDRIVDEQQPIRLDGSGSYDPEGQALFYQWSPISGDDVHLNMATTKNPTFTTPVVANGEIKTLVFELKVFDENGRFATDSVVITVDPVNAQPTAKVSATQE